MIFITPIDNTTKNITRKQVCSIYLDYGIKNWNKLNGYHKTLVPICRNADRGSQLQMNNLNSNNQKIGNRIIDNYAELTMEGVLEQVAFYHDDFSEKPSNSYDLGYSLYTYLENVNSLTGISEQLKTLSFNGVYPTSDVYHAVVRSDLPKENVTWSILPWLKLARA